MKLRSIIWLGLLLIVSAGCKKDTKVLKTSNVSEKYGANCPNQPCPEVSIDYLKFDGDPIVSEEINTKISNYIVNIINVNERKLDSNSIGLASQVFIDDYIQDKIEFPDITTPYSAEIVVSKVFDNPKLLCLEMQHYLFTGGAHGFGAVFYMNLDPATGERLETEDLLIDTKGFVDFAEKKFRENFTISSEDGINSTGFWFEDDVFSLPETIGFTDQKVILIYNQYNIASYADGPIELIISLKEAKPFLKLF